MGKQLNPLFFIVVFTDMFDFRVWKQYIFWLSLAFCCRSLHINGCVRHIDGDRWQRRWRHRKNPTQKPNGMRMGKRNVSRLAFQVQMPREMIYSTVHRCTVVDSICYMEMECVECNHVSGLLIGYHIVRFQLVIARISTLHAKRPDTSKICASKHMENHRRKEYGKRK